MPKEKKVYQSKDSYTIVRVDSQAFKHTVHTHIHFVQITKVDSQANPKMTIVWELLPLAPLPSIQTTCLPG